MKRLGSPLAYLRHLDESRLAGRDATVDERWSALWRAGVRDVEVEGCPQPGNHGRLFARLTLPDGTRTVVEASTYAVLLDRAEAQAERALRTP